MKNIVLTFLFLIPLPVFLSSCSAVIDEEALTKQLEASYSACKDEGINDISSLENILNSGGNNLSRSCRDALGEIDYAGIISAFNITLNFEIPSPGKEINPLLYTTSSWQNFASWSPSDSIQIISTGLDTTDQNQSNLTLQGVGSTGIKSNIANFTISDFTVDDIAISYTTDYSGSMLESDIKAVDSYFQDFHSTLPTSTSASVAIFSDNVTAKTMGFNSDSTTINAALSFDNNYTRASTALYDAWGDALSKLEAENKSLSINIITTDGFENSSSIYTSASAIRQKIIDSNAFNIVIASSWAEPNTLASIVGNKGIVIYKYQIDEAQKIIANIKTMLENIKVVKINDGVSSFNSIEINYNGDTKLSFDLP